MESHSVCPVVSLSMVSSEFIHFVACVRILFTFKAISYGRYILIYVALKVFYDRSEV